MALGPGKYDELCTEVRERAQAAAAIVMVFGGKEGTGFSVQAPPELNLTLPSVLRNLAAMIEEDMLGVAPGGLEGFNLTNFKDLEFICDAAYQKFKETGHLTWADRAVKYGAICHAKIAKLE